MPEYGEETADAARVYALDAVSAAERAAHDRFYALEYPPVMDFLIRPEADDDAPWEPYTVEIEMAPVFTARKRRQREGARA
jgi:hypothetical protein